MKQRVIGDWRITETEVWDQDALDLAVPAHLRLDRDGLGYLELIAIQADVDYRVTTRDGLPSVEFTWHGDDDGQETCGRGWAVVEGDRLRGRLFIHRGDESSFLAERSAALHSSVTTPQGSVRPAGVRGGGSRQTRGRG
jgi:hypothetical protein